ncbi:MAG: glycosyltransferase [Candidatus Heimdallarchaeota archaeon]|nr:glycosyltransferase [Candidatus Heimdallarchaeota archaeon]
MGLNPSHLSSDVKELLRKQRKIQYLYNLGNGAESDIFHDNKFVYKVFTNWDPKYHNYLSTLVNRFEDANHIVSIIEYFDLIDNENLISFPVIVYPYFVSTPYTGESDNQLIDFLVECYNYGIVCWDIKPSNFVYLKNNLVLIDLGHDIKPLSLKDYVLMVQRTFLMIKYGKQSNFRTLARETRRFWTSSNLEGFNDFFNDIWKKLWKLNIVTKPKFPPLKIYPDLKLNSDSDYIVRNPKDTDFLFEKYQISKKSIILGDLINVGSFSKLLDNSIIFFSLESFSMSLIDWLFDILKSNIPPLNFELIIPNIYNLEKNILEYLIVNLNLKLCKTGYFLNEISESSSFFMIDNLVDFEYSIFKIEKLPELRSLEPVSLMIKVCYQDADILEKQILHIINQLNYPRSYFETYVVVDTKESEFLRQFNNPNKDKTIQILDKLLKFGLIDKVYYSPRDPNLIEKINFQWFGVKTNETHSIHNIPVTPQVFGFDMAEGAYVLQLDVDVFIGRNDINHDYLDDMMSALDDENALSVGFNIFHGKKSKNNPYSGDGKGGFVPEVRFGLLDLKKFHEQKPFPNSLDPTSRRLSLSWYRSVEQHQIANGLSSLRGGNSLSFYVHPPNTWKTDLNQYFIVKEKIEQLAIPPIQIGKFDLEGQFSDWLYPKRSENFIFVISGRNVSIPKFKRCWESIRNQTRNDWGAIIIDDSSENSIYRYIKDIFSSYRKDNVNFHQNHNRTGILYNMRTAINDICVNPYSVIIILDMDDFLLTNDFLEILYLKYLEGVEVTIGNTLRYEKGIYQLEPNLIKPRNKRMGDVWLHPRTFRKYLFDSIAIEDFKHEEKWIDRFTELTYMVPIIEMANNKHYFKWPLYFWQPTYVRNEDHYKKTRETKEAMLQKPNYSTLRKTKFIELIPFIEMIQLLINNRSEISQPIVVIRHAEKNHAFNEKYPNEMDRTSQLSENGIRHCQVISKILHNSHLTINLLSSNSDRTIQTAKFLLPEISGSTSKLLRQIPIKDENRWNNLYDQFSREDLYNRWRNNEIDPEIIDNYSDYIGDLRNLITSHQHENQLMVIITHDHIIRLLLWAINSIYFEKIPYLSGSILSINDFDQLKTR